MLIIYFRWYTAPIFPSKTENHVIAGAHCVCGGIFEPRDSLPRNKYIWYEIDGFQCVQYRAFLITDVDPGKMYPRPEQQFALLIVI